MADIEKSEAVMNPVNIAETDVQQETDEAVSITRLPFNFAKRHNALIEKSDTQYILHCLSNVDANVVLEVRRVLKTTFSIEFHSLDEFEQLLTISYQRDSSEAQQMMEDIGKEVDLYSLADELTETEDLLENEDDAPIIKLINAMLSEAIKENASDIHIETFEAALQIRFVLMAYYVKF